MQRERGIRVDAEAAAVSPDSVEPVEPAVLGRAVERLVISLPPKERACVLLKDVFDYTLEEIAELVGSTVGGVKAALKRGRSKLVVAQEQGAQPRAKNPEVARVLHLYVERFNRRDWDGVRDYRRRRTTARGGRFRWRRNRIALFRQLRALAGAVATGRGRSGWRARDHYHAA